MVKWGAPLLHYVPGCSTTALRHCIISGVLGIVNDGAGKCGWKKVTNTEPATASIAIMQPSQLDSHEVEASTSSQFQQASAVV